MSYSDHRYFEAYDKGPYATTTATRSEFSELSEAEARIMSIAKKYGIDHNWTDGDEDTIEIAFDNGGENYVGTWTDGVSYYFSDYGAESGPELDHPYTLPEFEYWFATLLGRGPAFLRRQIALLANELRRRGVPSSNAWKIAHEVCRTSESHTAKAWLDWSEIVIHFTKRDGAEVWKRSRLHTFERKGSAVCFWSETDNAYRSFNRDRLIQIRVADDSQTQFITLAA